MKSYNFKVRSFQPLTDTQWANIADLVENPYTTGRPRQVNLRKVVDGLPILYEQVVNGVMWTQNMKIRQFYAIILTFGAIIILGLKC